MPTTPTPTFIDAHRYARLLRTARALPELERLIRHMEDRIGDDYDVDLKFAQQFLWAVIIYNHDGLFAADSAKAGAGWFLYADKSTAMRALGASMLLSVVLTHPSIVTVTMQRLQAKLEAVMV